MTPPLPATPEPSGTATLHWLLTTAFGAAITFGLMAYLHSRNAYPCLPDCLQEILSETAFLTLLGCLFGMLGLWYTMLAFQWASVRWVRQPQRARLIPFAAVTLAFSLVELSTLFMNISPGPYSPILGHIRWVLASWETASLLAVFVVLRLAFKATEAN